MLAPSSVCPTTQPCAVFTKLVATGKSPLTGRDFLVPIDGGGSVTSTLTADSSRGGDHPTNIARVGPSTLKGPGYELGPSGASMLSTFVYGSTRTGLQLWPA